MKTFFNEDAIGLIKVEKLIPIRSELGKKLEEIETSEQFKDLDIVGIEFDGWTVSFLMGTTED